MPNIFNIKSPDFIKVSDKPITDKDCIINMLLKHDMLLTFCFEYTENIVLDTTAYKTLIKNQKHTTKELNPGQRQLIEKIKNRLKYPLNNSLVVSFINETVGYGLFTQENIKSGTIIGLYSGQFETIAGAQYSLPAELILNPGFSKMKQKCEAGDYVSVCCHGGGKLNAGLVGGLLRFIQHMPTNEVQILQKLEQATTIEALNTLDFLAYGVCMDDKTVPAIKQELDHAIRSSFSSLSENASIQQALNNPDLHLASANINYVNINYYGFPIVCMIAARDILATEQLGWDYGEAYWTYRGQSPAYFNKQTGYPVNSDVILNRRTLSTRLSSASSAGIFQVKAKTPYEQAVIFYNSKQYSKAIDQLFTAIESYQQDKGKLATCYNTLASCHRELDEYDRAIEACQAAVTLRQELLLTNPSIQHLLDQSLQKLQNLQEHVVGLNPMGNSLT